MAARLSPDRPAFVPGHAMVLAAGLGLRMRPLTQNVPKPLLEVGGATMLDHALDRLDDAGVTDVVVNTHWLPEKIEAHLERRATPSITISREDDLLETGGGIAKALPLLGTAPFYAANDGDGDFMMDPVGLLERRPERVVAPFVFTGVQILHPRLFADAPDGAFSMNVLYDRALEAGRLFGIAHDGDWYHVGTPPAIAEADAEILEREGSRVRLLF